MRNGVDDRDDYASVVNTQVPLFFFKEILFKKKHVPTLSEFFLIGLDHSFSCLELPFEKKCNPDRQIDGRTTRQHNASGLRRTEAYKLSKATIASSQNNITCLTSEIAHFLKLREMLRVVIPWPDNCLCKMS